MSQNSTATSIRERISGLDLGRLKGLAPIAVLFGLIFFVGLSTPEFMQPRA